MKAYNVVSVFDSGFAWNLAGITVSSCIRRQDDSVYIPNAPIPARETWLAQCLRTGRGIAWRVDGGGLIPITKANFRRHRPAPVGSRPFSIPSLNGRLIGVEIEYYPDSRQPSESMLQQVTGDGSLGPSGIEVRRLTWADDYGRLQGVLEGKLSGHVDRNCGLHVHVDARHLGKGGLLTAQETYYKLLACYPFLKRLVPRSRHKNTYCKWRDSIATNDRYCAVNFQSFGQHQTIEFRCQSGSTNPLKIESWALVCQRLLYCMSHPNCAAPATWAHFLKLFPEPLRSWCVIRYQSLHLKQRPVFNERSQSAAE